MAEPRLFTELVQHSKLHNRDRRLPALSDKVAIKSWVADRIGRRWVTPTLWQGPELPERCIWTPPFVVKSRHGCNQTAFVRSANHDWRTVRRAARRWTTRAYGQWLDEWLYLHIPRGILVEPYIGTGPNLPIDYKFYVFGGRVAFVQVHLGRGARHRWIVFDRSWRRVSSASPDADPARPATLSHMIEAAEELSAGLEFARVDLYEVQGKPLFGEMTFYPGSGLDQFDPPALDRVMGDLWIAARALSIEDADERQSMVSRAA